MENVKGKVIAITGASSGIGRATALRLAKRILTDAVAHALVGEGPRTPD